MFVERIIFLYKVGRKASYCFYWGRAEYKGIMFRVRCFIVQ